MWSKHKPTSIKETHEMTDIFSKQSIAQQMIMAQTYVTGEGMQSKGIILIDGINCEKVLLRKSEVLELGSFCNWITRDAQGWTSNIGTARMTDGENRAAASAGYRGEEKLNFSNPPMCGWGWVGKSEAWELPSSGVAMKLWSFIPCEAGTETLRDRSSVIWIWSPWSLP